MSTFWCLTKRLVKNTLKPTFADDKERKKYIISVVALAVCLGIPVILGVVGAYGLVKASLGLGYAEGVYSMIFLSAQVVTIFFGLFAYVNVMYFSKDNEFLFTLPVKSVTVFWAKLLVVFIYELMFSAIIVIPMCVVGAVAIVASGLSLSAAYVVMTILAVVTLPLMALLIVALLSYPLLYVFKFFKKHPTVGAVVVIVLVVGIYMAIYMPILFSTQTTVEGGEASGDVSGEVSGDVSGDAATGDDISFDELYAQILPGITTAGRYSYHTLFLAKSMLGGDGIRAFGYAMAYLGIVAALALIGSLCAALIYKRLAYSVLEGNGGVSARKQNKPTVQLSVDKALLKREANSVFKNTTLLIQAGMMTLLPPILVFFLCKINFASAQQSANSLFVAVGVAEILIKLMGVSNLASTIAISREGDGIFMLKTYPVSYEKIVEAKLRLANIMSWIMVGISTLAFMLTGVANIVAVIGLLAGNIVYMSAMNKYSIYRDLKKPKVHWKNIVEITNNNISTLIPMLIGSAGGIFILIATVLIALLPINEYLVALIYCAISMGVSLVYFFSIKAKTNDNVAQLFERIE